MNESTNENQKLETPSGVAPALHDFDASFFADEMAKELTRQIESAAFGDDRYSFITSGLVTVVQEYERLRADERERASRTNSDPDARGRLERVRNRLMAGHAEGYEWVAGVSRNDLDEFEEAVCLSLNELPLLTEGNLAARREQFKDTLEEYGDSAVTLGVVDDLILCARAVERASRDPQPARDVLAAELRGVIAAYEMQARALQRELRTGRPISMGDSKEQDRDWLLGEADRLRALLTAQEAR